MTITTPERPLADAAGDDAGSAHQPVPEDDDELRDEITTLAGHIAAATCRFLVLLGELDARGAWAGVGILGPAHWLSFRCAMGEVAAREHVRVARALRHLPRTVEAFAAGRISYSKVRAITRVATPETEPDLVGLALAAPANHVERLVRGLRTAQSIEEVRDRNARRSLTWRWAEDGALVLSGRFSPEDGAAIVEALECVRERADRELAGAATGPEDQSDLIQPEPQVRSRRSLADALVELCGAVPPDGSGGPRTTRPVETVVHVTLSDLRGEEATGACQGPRPAPPAPSIAPTCAAPAPQALAPAEPAGTPCLADGPGLHPAVARRLACDGGIVLQVHQDGVGVSGRTLEVGARIRRPGSALLRALTARDRGCRFPGCGRRRFLHAHHVRFWADGGPTVLANLVLLCGAHHRLLHEGGYTLSMDADGAVTVRDRRGAPVRPVPASTGTCAGARRAAERSAASGRGQDGEPGIGPWTITARWGGEPLDMSYATSILLEGWQVDARRRAERAVPRGDGRPQPGPGCGSVGTDGRTSP